MLEECYNLMFIYVVTQHISYTSDKNDYFYEEREANDLIEACKVRELKTLIY